MRVIDIKAIEGANIFCHKPVIKLTLDLEEYAEVPTDRVPGFKDRLLQHIPTLIEHYCSRGKPGGFIERVDEGTYIGHVIEHVALELQHLAGIDAIYGKTVQVRPPGVYSIVTEYECKEAGIQALLSAVELVSLLLENKEVDVRTEIDKVRITAAKYALGPSTSAIADEAVKRGIPVLRLGNGSILQLGYGKFQKRVEATITCQTGCIGVDIACDKLLTKQLLEEAGIPVAQGAAVSSPEAALFMAGKLGDAVVIKPCNGNHGRGVTVNLKTKEEIVTAFKQASVISDKVIVEKYIEGKHYRLTVVGDKVVAAAERIPAFVVGDGHSSIKELVDFVNKDPMRGEGHEKPLTKIKIDENVLMVLGKKGLTPETILEEGAVVYLRDTANLSTGGLAKDVTGYVHPGTLETAVRAVRLIGLDVAGVDIVARDIKKPLTEDNGAIIEINAAPGIRMHQNPSHGKPRNVASAIVEKLFPQGTNARIPIVSVTGTNGKTTVVRMISHILQLAGLKVGSTTTDGIYLGGKKILNGDSAGPKSAQTVLKDPTVEAAVLETARGGIIRAGLGYDCSEVGIITNISNDHLGIDGVETLEDMAYVKAVVAEAVCRSGFTVLNADDKYVLPIAQRTRSRIIYFSTTSDNLTVRRHLGIGGTAVFIKNGWIVVSTGLKTKKISAVKQIPCCMGGLVRHNIQNAVAAVSGCIALGIKADFIRKGLLGFNCDENCNPGRFNFFEIGSKMVVVDYGHNEAGYTTTLETIKKLTRKRIIGVIGMPGDRKDEDIYKVGKVAAKYCHQIFIKEDQSPRGRKTGEVANILQSAVISSGMGKEDVEIVLSETDAVKRALHTACEGDIVVVFYENLAPVLDILKIEKENPCHYSIRKEFPAITSN